MTFSEAYPQISPDRNTAPGLINELKPAACPKEGGVAGIGNRTRQTGAQQRTGSGPQHSECDTVNVAFSLL